MYTASYETSMGTAVLFINLKSFGLRFEVRSKKKSSCVLITSFICQNVFPKLSQKRNLSLNSIRSGHQKWPAYEWLAVAYPTKLFVYNF